MEILEHGILQAELSLKKKGCQQKFNHCKEADRQKNIISKYLKSLGKAVGIMKAQLL